MNIRKYNTFVVSAPERSPAATAGKTLNIVLVCGIVAAVVLIAVVGTFAVRKVKGQRYGNS